MAASIEQKLDFLLKKIGYVASKTGIAEDSTLSGTKKAPFGEAIPSPLVVPANSVWAQASEIPATPPGADTPYVRVYLSGASGHRMTVDNTVSGNRTFIARSTYNNNSSSILGDWIDTSFGADYIIEVYKGDPNSGGVKLSAAGSGSNDTWFFDYSSGVLNFNGTVVPSGVTSSNIYIVGYRYIGIKGVATPGGSSSFTDVSTGGLSVTGIATIFNTTDNTLGNENTGSVQLDGGMGIAKNLTVKQNLHVGGYAEFVGVATFKGGTINLGDADTDDINVGGEFVSDLIPDIDDTYSLGSSSKQWKNLFINGHAELDNTVISGVSTFTSPLDINTDVDIDGHTELDNVNIAGVTTFQSNAFFGDADYIQMGDAQDLKIGHVGSYSVILDQGAGNLSIGGDGFVDIMNTALDEYKARFTTNGSVELYFDNVNKFETTGYGATVFGTLQSQQLNVSGISTFNDRIHLPDNTKIMLGDNNDLQIVHIPNFNSIQGDQSLYLQSPSEIILKQYNGSEVYAKFTKNSSVELYYDNSKKFETTGYGATVFGTLQSQQLNVTGVSTYAGAIDVNGDLDVDGHTNLDNVNISGVTTTGGLLDINAGGQANTFKVEDLTDNRVVIAGTGGELEDDANLTFNGSTLSVGVDLDVDGHTELDNVNISGVTTVAGNIDANGDLDVDGHTNLDNLSVSGVTTFTGTLTASGSLNLSGDLDVDRHTNLDNVSVAGVTTFTGAIDANGDLDVDGHTNLDNVSIAGVTTFTGAIDANGDLDVDGTTELDVLNVAETATFSANIDANGDLDVDGHTELDNVNISGVATATAFHTGAEGSAIRVTSNTISGPAEMFIDPAGVGDNTGALRIKGDLFVDGTQTVINSTTIELGDFIVGIATTATTDSLADGAGIKIGPDNTFLYDHSNTSLKSSENLNLASGKVYKIDGTDVLSATTLGSGVVNSSLTSLGTLLGLTVSGQTTLNTLGVTGVSTFTGALDVNNHVDVVGGIDADHINTTGVSTFQGGSIDIANAVRHIGDPDTMIRFPAQDTVLARTAGTDRLIIGPTGVSTFTGAIDANGDLDVDGHTELDNLNVTGVSTFSGNLNLSGNITSNLTISSTDAGSAAAPEVKLYRNSASPADADYLGQIKFAGESDTGVERNYAKITGKILDASNGTEDGIIEFAHIKGGSQNISARFRSDSLQLLNGTNFSVAGDSTFTGDVDANGDLDVDGHTNLDNVSVAGVTTFAGKIVGAATDNVIPFLYSTMGDLPNAGTYHGAFAHVHNQGKGFFAHGGNWYELVNKEQNGTVGTGTERYNVGQIDATDVDVSGITTSVSLHVGVGGTVITASGIGSVGINSTAPAYALDVIGDINSSTDIKVNGVSIVGSSSGGASLDDVVALAIALG